MLKTGNAYLFLFYYSFIYLFIHILIKFIKIYHKSNCESKKKTTEIQI